MLLQLMIDAIDKNMVGGACFMRFWFLLVRFGFEKVFLFPLPHLVVVGSGWVMVYCIPIFLLCACAYGAPHAFFYGGCGTLVLTISLVCGKIW